MSKNVKIVVFVPETYADQVRKAMGDAGAGKIGNYIFCSFSSKGMGRYKPEEGAEPFAGEIGELEEAKEERIEMVCERKLLKKVIDAMKEAHPYDEVAFDVYALEDIE